MFDKILIANRGEIACRVIRTCRRLGIRTVAVYSEADADAQHVRLADEAYPIGGPRPQDSYLRGDAIIEVAQKSGAQAIHPGYGFLSENADFADAVEAAGLVFIGPKAASMRKMGSKAGAKELMQAARRAGGAGLHRRGPVARRCCSAKRTRSAIPLMIKAAHGGGGKGMRIVRALRRVPAGARIAASARRRTPSAATACCSSATSSSRATSRSRCSATRTATRSTSTSASARRSAATRRCSRNRRRRSSTPELRDAMGEAAVAAARAIDYVNAGTVEFIVGPDGGFYFMEINTRLQVEHPVTELVTGLDLVEWQLRVAAGEAAAAARRTQIRQRRPRDRSAPVRRRPGSRLPARLRQARTPAPAARRRARAHRFGRGRRRHGDDLLRPDDRQAHRARRRPPARARPPARGAGRNARSSGRSRTSTSSNAWCAIRRSSTARSTPATSTATSTSSCRPTRRRPPTCCSPPRPRSCSRRKPPRVARAARLQRPASPWAIADGWRLGHARQARSLAFLHRGERLELRRARQRRRLPHRARRHRRHAVAGARLADDALSAAHRRRAAVASRSTWTPHARRGPRRRAPPATGAGGGVSSRRRRRRRRRRPRHRADAGPRGAWSRRAAGDAVDAGQELLVIEAMKMELSLKAPRDGTRRRSARGRPAISSRPTPCW